MRAFQSGPYGWQQAGNGESFKLSTANALTGETVVFARTGNRYWHFIGSSSLDHRAIMQKVQAVTNQEREDLVA